VDEARHLQALRFLARSHVEISVDAAMARIRRGLAEATTVQRLRALWIVVGAHPTLGAALRAEVVAFARDWQRADGDGQRQRRDVVRDLLAWYDQRAPALKVALGGGT
jgi:hypothetical protein